MRAHVTHTACLHGTFVAGILSARRASPGPGNLSRLVRCSFARFFPEATSGRELRCRGPTLNQLAAAVIECIDAGARVINLSLALAQPSIRSRAFPGRRPHPGREARRDCRGGRGQSGHPGKFRHHPASVGHPGRRVRHARQTDERVEPGPFDRPAGASARPGTTSAASAPKDNRSRSAARAWRRHS